MPKIDWSDDPEDLPRWEPRPRRERVPREVAERRLRLERIIAMSAAPLLSPTGPAKRPLHLIWGEPLRRSASPDSPPPADS